MKRRPIDLTINTMHLATAGDGKLCKSIVNFATFSASNNLLSTTNLEVTIYHSIFTPLSKRMYDSTIICLCKNSSSVADSYVL